MRLPLNASFRLSGDATPAEGAISGFFANSTPFAPKGAPESHSAKITGQKLAGKKIDLTIESNRFVRSTRCTSEASKAPAELLGKKYHIECQGHRDLQVRDGRV